MNILIFVSEDKYFHWNMELLGALNFDSPRFNFEISFSPELLNKVLVLGF